MLIILGYIGLTIVAFRRGWRFAACVPPLLNIIFVVIIDLSLQRQIISLNALRNIEVFLWVLRWGGLAVLLLMSLKDAPRKEKKNPHMLTPQ
jgi:hypothetical protein